MTLGWPGNWSNVEITENDKAQIPSDPALYDGFLYQLQDWIQTISIEIEEEKNKKLNWK